MLKSQFLCTSFFFFMFSCAFQCTNKNFLSSTVASQNDSFALLLLQFYWIYWKEDEIQQQQRRKKRIIFIDWFIENHWSQRDDDGNKCRNYVKQHKIQCRIKYIYREFVGIWKIEPIEEKCKRREIKNRTKEREREEKNAIEKKIEENNEVLSENCVDLTMLISCLFVRSDAAISRNYPPILINFNRSFVANVRERESLS